MRLRASKRSPAARKDLRCHGAGRSSEHQQINLYDAGFYDELVGGALRSARAIIPSILRQITVRSAIDIGCGRGAWLRALEEEGVSDTIGCDGDYVEPSTLLIDPAKFTAVDLREEFPIDRRFDLAISLEVAEHLPSNCAESFVRRLIAAAPIVLFSAAVPGQPGVHHINAQWQDYWRSIFRSHSYHPVDMVRPKIWGDPDIEYWYRQNIVLYCSEEALDRNPAFQTVPDNVSLNMIHPALYEIQLEQIALYRKGGDLLLKEALRVLPSLARNSISRRIKRLRLKPRSRLKQ